ncbi:MAG: hypothetical protein WCO90_09450, partial [Planctomycetota bacterium]
HAARPESCKIALKLVTSELRRARIVLQHHQRGVNRLKSLTVFLEKRFSAREKAADRWISRLTT